MENWIDLTRDSLQPVLSFTSEGDYSVCGAGIGHRVVGKISAFSDQRLKVSYRIGFQVFQDGEEIHSAGSRRDHAVYTRSPSGDFQLNEKLSTLNATELTEFYDLGNPDFRSEAFLKFDLESLRKIASDPKTRT